MMRIELVFALVFLPFTAKPGIYQPKKQHLMKFLLGYFPDQLRRVTPQDSVRYAHMEDL